MSVAWPVLAATVLAVFWAVGSSQQMSSKVGNEVFLKGNFIEVGIHSVASYGTAFIADYGKDGWSSGPFPQYSGDYFLPGSPLEGWSVDYTASGVRSAQYICKGRVGGTMITPSFVSDTSVTGRLSAVWVGQAANLKVSKSTSFGVNDLYFTTTVTLQNMGTTQMTAVNYMRNVDPDQEQPWSGNFATRNYVLYQPRQTGDTTIRTNPSSPNMCLVVAVGVSYPALALGLGTVNPFCRVTHYGFRNDDSTQGWTDSTWQSHTQSSPRNADEGINMVLRFPTLDIGASVTFTWAYVLNIGDLLPAMNGIGSVSVIQPTDTASGSSCLFSANVLGSVSSVSFFVSFGASQTLVGTATTASPADPSGLGGVYSCRFDSTIFVSSAGYTFTVSAVIGGSTVQTSKVITIDNNGPRIAMSITPTMTSPWIIDNVNTFTVGATFVSGPAISMMMYYLDLSTNSTFLGSSSTGPNYPVTFSATSLPLFTLVTIRAVSRAASGATQVTTSTGIVSMPNLAPTGLSLAPVKTSTSGPAIDETDAPGVVVGTLSSTDPNPGDTFTYTMVTTGSKFAIVGSSLVIAAGATFEFYTQSSFAITIRTTDQGGLSFSRSITIFVRRVNLPPTNIVISSSSIIETAPKDTAVGTFTVTSRDSSSFTMSLLSNGGGSFYVSGMTLFTAKTLSYAATPSLSISVQARDSNSLTFDKEITIAVNWANKPPTFINLTSTTVLEMLPIGTVVGNLLTTDPDPGQSFTYSLNSDGGGRFRIVGTQLQTKIQLNYLAGALININIKSTDNGAPPPATSFSAMPAQSYSQGYTIVIMQNPAPPQVSDTVLSVPENVLLGTIVGAVYVAPGSENVPMNFTINTTQSDQASYALSTTRGCFVMQPAYAFFRMQLCSGTIYVNSSCLNFEARNDYKLRTTVVAQGFSTTVTVTINVIDVNEAPEPADQTVSINEHSVAGTTVVASIPANDPDFSATASYAIVSGNLGGMFAINGTSGRVSLALSTLNFQNLPIGQKYYSLFVSVTDQHGLAGYCTITVNVLNVPEPPHVNPCTGLSIAENSPVGALVPFPVVGRDEDGNDISFSVVSGADNNPQGLPALAFTAPFTVGGPLDRANLTVIRAIIDYETTSGFVYTLNARALDTAGQSLLFTCPVAVIDVNEAPWTPPTAAFTVRENMPGGTRLLMGNGTGTLYAWDPDLSDFKSWLPLTYSTSANVFFTLNSAGNLSLLAPPNFEAQSVYWIVASVTDKGGLSATTNITITVTDVNEAPELPSSTTRFLAENAVIGADVRVSNQRVDICANDPDFGQTLAYTLSPTNAGFAVSSVAGCARIVSTRMFDFEAMTPMGGPVALNLSVCDNGAPQMCSISPVTVVITDVNEAPVLNATNIAIGEDAKAGASVGAPLSAHDQDVSDSVTFTLVTNGGGVFVLNTVVGSPRLAQLSVAPSFVGKLRDVGPRWFPLNVSVSDSGGLSTSAIMNVSLLFAADPPVVFPATFSVQESVPEVPAGSGVGTVVGTVQYFNRQNYTVELTIIGGDVLGQFAIHPTTGVLTVTKATLNFYALPQYVLTIQAKDFPPNITNTQFGSAIVVINVTHVNRPPILPTLPILAIPENVAGGFLIGGPIVATDVDVGDNLTYSLTSFGTIFAIGRTSGQVSLISSGVLDFTVTSTYTVGVQVTDAGGLFARANMVINLILVPTPPILYGGNRSISENSAAGAPIGAPLTWYDRDSNTGFVFNVRSVIGFKVVSWVRDAHGKQVFTFTPIDVDPSVFTIGTSGSLSVGQAVLDYETIPIYRLNVSITDIQSLSATAAVFVNLIDVNEVPSFNFSSVTTKFIPENSVVGTPIPAPVVGLDVDFAQNLTYSIPPGQNVFGIHSANGSLFVSRAVLDFETQSLYTITVTVTDSGAPQNPGNSLSASTTVAIQLTDVNEAPTATFKGLTLYVDENCCNPQAYDIGVGSVIGSLPVFDIDAADKPAGVLQVTFQNGSYNVFSLNSSTHVLSVLAPLDFETRSVYSFAAVVTDHGGLKDNGTVTVILNDVNEIPFIAPQNRSINENSAKNAPVGLPILASDVDANQFLSFTITAGNSLGYFQINPCSGQITVLNPGLNARGMSSTLNFESVNTFPLTITVTDNGDPILSSSATVVVTLNDVNEPPLMTPMSFSIAENSPTGTLVGTPIPVWDEDAFDTRRFGISGGNPSGFFVINATTGQLSVGVAGLDFERQSMHTLSVTVWDKGNLTDTQTVLVSIINVNEAPVVISGQERTVPENSPVGARASGFMLSYWDPENDTVSWAISGGFNASVFSINPDSGVFFVAQAVLNYESYDQYTLIVTATDTGRLPQADNTVITVDALSSSNSVKINVLDVLEAPVVPSLTLSVPENFFFSALGPGPFNTIFGSFFVYCEDFVKALSYSIVDGDPLQVFRAVDVDGGKGTVNMTLFGSVNFETQSQYVLTVVARHSTIAVSGLITVNILDVNEMPYFGVSQQTPNASFSMRVKELSSAGTPLTRVDNGALNGVTALDVDANDTMTYTIVAGNNVTKFNIHPSTGVITVAAGADLNFQVATQFWVLVCATDSGDLKAYANVSISLIQVNKPPFFVNVPIGLGVGRLSPAGTVITVLSGKDFMNNPFVFAISNQQSPGLFGIHAANGSVTVTGDRTLLVLGSTFWIEFTMTQTSTADGSSVMMSSPLTLVLTVTDQNYPPLLSPPVSYSVPENSPTSRIIGILPFFDVDNATQTFTFTVSVPHLVRVVFNTQSLVATLFVNGSLDHETLPQFGVTVTVSDNYPSGAMTDTRSFVVYVDDVNEAPAIAVSQFYSPDGMSSLRIRENATGTIVAGMLVGDVIVTDPDDSGIAWGQQSFTFVSALPQQPFPFSISTVSGDARRGRVFLLEDGPLSPNFHVINTYLGTLTVTDGGGLTATSPANVSVVHMNRPPTMNPFSFSVGESVGVGAVIGTVFGDDADKPVSLSFRIIAGNEDGRFEMDALGKITVAASLDFEAVMSYNLTVQATDRGVAPADPVPLSVVSYVTIQVLNVNDVTVTGFSGAVNHTTAGGETVYIEGTNLGMLPSSGVNSTTIHAMYGVSGTEYRADCSVVNPNSLISCITAPGAGRLLRWRVFVTVPGYITSDSALSTAGLFTAYLPPTIIALSDSTRSMTTSGGDTVAVFGVNFGPLVSDASITYFSAGRFYSMNMALCSLTAANPSALIADSVTRAAVSTTPNAQQLLCKSSPGVGHNLTWSVGIKGQSSASFNSLLSAYAVPSVTSVTPSTARFTTRGGETVTILGANFGVSSLDLFNNVTVYYGPAADRLRYTARSCSVQTAHSRIVCMTTTGVGSGHVWSVSVGEQLSAASTDRTQYAVPTVSKVSGPGTYQAKTDGGQAVTIKGTEFGTVADALNRVVVTYGRDGTRFTAEQCAVINNFDTIQCVTAPGTGKELNWYVSIDGQRSELNMANTSYGQPVVAFYNGSGTIDGSADCLIGALDCGITQGSQFVDVNGLNYGPAALNNSLTVTYGPTGTELFAEACFIIEDHIRIRCKTTPGAGAKLVWKVVIDEQMSVFPTTAYGPPRITAISGPGSDEASTYGGELVVITGANFGPPEHQEVYNPGVTYGGYVAVNVTVVSHNVIHCFTVPGIGRNLKWIVFVGGQQSGEIVTSSYAMPTITSWNYDEINPRTTGGYTLRVRGTNFGAGQFEVLQFVQVLGRLNPTIELTPTSVVAGGVHSFDASGKLVQNPDVVSFVMPPGRGRGLGVRVGVDHIIRSPDTQLFSQTMDFHYAGPRATLITTKILTGYVNGTCDVYNPVKGANLSDSDVIFDVEVRGFNFGPGNAAGNGPLQTADSVMLPWTMLDPYPLPEYMFPLVCFTTWEHNLMRFSVPYKGTVGVNLTSVGLRGEMYQDDSEVLKFDFNLPTIMNLKGIGQRDRVAGNGTSSIRITGRNLFTVNVPVNVTIGGELGGRPIDPSRVTFGSLNVTDVPGVISTEPNQFVDVVVPPWQGTGIPLMVFQVFPASAPGSQPFYVDVEPPKITRALGSSGVASHSIPQAGTNDQYITAKTDGSSRVVLSGVNFGFNGTYIRFVNVFKNADGSPSTLDRNFTNCVFNDTEIECTAPRGIGAFDSNGVPLQINVVVPRLECDRNEQETTPSDPLVREWSRCTVVVDPTGKQATSDVSWYFRYEPPVIYPAPANTPPIPSTGGPLTIFGHNLGTEEFGMPVVTVYNARHDLLQSCDLVAPPGPAINGLQNFTVNIPAGVGSGWTLRATVGGQALIADNYTFSYAAPRITAISRTTGDTSGGYNVTITGQNFGGPLFTSFGSVSVEGLYDETNVTRRLVVDVSKLYLLSHDSITFTMPPEQGPKLVSVTIDGQVSNMVPFQFSAPRLQVMDPVIIPTLGHPWVKEFGDPPAVVALTGASFGTRGARVEVSYPATNITVYPNADYLNTTDPLGAAVNFTRSLPSINCTRYNPEEQQTCFWVSQGHNTIGLRMPPGMGVNASIRVFVTTGEHSVASESLRFDYAAPVIGSVVPNIINAIGDTVRIYGDNFGVTSNDNMKPVVIIGGRKCLNANLFPAEDKTIDPRPYIQCTSQDDVVGPRNISVTVAYRTVNVSYAAIHTKAQCFDGYFGSSGEFCDPCPEGAVCKAANIAYSLPGWYNVTYNGVLGCSARHKNSSVCWQPLPCQPPDACIGSNECSPSYMSKEPILRCAACSPNHYRLSGECIKCPSNPWILIIGFIVAAVALAVLGYFLNRKSINIAFLSIGIDYFQVLAMFSRSNIDWPPTLKDLYQALSAFNFNIDITAPECAMPNLGYTSKWYFVEGVPLAALSLFGTLHVVQYLRKKIILRRKKKLHSHVPALVGTSLVMMYYLYLNLTRSVLDVFNCQPTTPATDGKLYLQVVFEECGKKGGIQMTLMPFAICAMVFYCFGYPLIVAYILYKNRHKIMEDQLLRAEDMGTTRLENPHCYDLRKMYHKMYYHFRPDCWFWLLVVLARKFIIAMTALMFSRNPAFQMAICLLALFIAYALQVRFSPYMSMSERQEILFQHRRAAELGNRTHAMLASILADVKRQGKKITAKTDMDTKVAKVRATAYNFFWNYNTVEATLLFCAVLVNLAGVMFESGQLDLPGYDTQKDFITYVTLLVIVFSIVYFAVVLVSEIYMMCKMSDAKTGKDGKGKGKNGEKDSKLSKTSAPRAFDVPLSYSSNDNSSEVVNPMFDVITPNSVCDTTIQSIIRLSSPPTPEQWKVVQEQYHAAMSANLELQSALNAAKRFQQQVGGVSQFVATRRVMAQVRREFAPVDVETGGASSALESGRAVPRVQTGRLRRASSKRLTVPIVSESPLYSLDVKLATSSV